MSDTTETVYEITALGLVAAAFSRQGVALEVIAQALREVQEDVVFLPRQDVEEGPDAST